MVARKRYYHKNKKGEWKPCSSPDRCPFREHRLSEDQDYEMNSGNLFLKELTRMKAFEEEVKSKEDVPFEGDPLYGRNDMRELAKRLDKDPSLRGRFLKGYFQTDVDGPAGKLGMRAIKYNRVLGTPPRRLTGWSFQMVDREKNERIFIHEKEIGTELEGKLFKKAVVSQVLAEFRRIYPEQGIADREALKYLRGFFDYVSSVEVEDQGVIGATALGFSFFSESKKNEVIAKANYSKTTFRGKHVKEILEAPQYRYEDPDLTILVQDSNLPKTLANWAINSTNGVWTLIKTDSEGKTTVDAEILDAEELSEKVYEFCKQEMHYTPEEEQEVRAYCKDLVDEVNEARAEHQTRRIEFLQEQAANTTDPKFREMYYESIGLPDPDLEARSGKKLSGFLGRVFG